MSRACISHFDGDPYLLNYWLKLAEKNIFPVVDKVYITINQKRVTPEMRAYEDKLIAKYPKLVATFGDWSIPEAAQPFLLAQVQEDHLVMIESDGFVFDAGIVARCFDLVENQNQAIAAPKWDLIYNPIIRGDFGVPGYMRCFFFCKTELLRSIEFDLFPKEFKTGDHIEGMEKKLDADMALDCFGWVSVQLALKRLPTTWIDANLSHPDDMLDWKKYEAYPWIHVRQMGSSALGLGAGESLAWMSDSNLPELVLRWLNEEWEDGPAQFTYLKAVAFRRLFTDYFEDTKLITEFAGAYRRMLDLVTDLYNLDERRVGEIVGFFKHLSKL